MVSHETPDHRIRRRRSLCRSRRSGRHLSGSRSKDALLQATAETVLHAEHGYVEPHRFADRVISSRVYCNPKALWKLTWFLRDFGYDDDLLGRDEVDERQLVGLAGVVKISHIVFNGTSLLRFDGFASANRWEELSPANLDNPQVAR
jgi:hypothetical protein